VTVLSVATLQKAFEGTLAGDPELDPAARAAAVSAIFRDGRGGLEVLLIRRAERTGDPWSGHMAFPGGRRDPSDENLLATSVRETREEIGLDLTKGAELIGSLPDHIPGAWRKKEIDLFIRPYVFRLTTDALDLTMNAEVTEVVWAAVGPMISGERATTTTLSFDGTSFELPAFDLDGRIVWGITFRRLSDVFARLRAITETR
jgi:8-oxo-dGTP pyrophosphatase MutT (NUDIX family)